MALIPLAFRGFLLGNSHPDVVQPNINLPLPTDHSSNG
jgi:hypothetical protein